MSVGEQPAAPQGSLVSNYTFEFGTNSALSRLLGRHPCVLSRIDAFCPLKRGQYCKAFRTAASCRDGTTYSVPYLLDLFLSFNVILAICRGIFLRRYGTYI